MFWTHAFDGYLLCTLTLTFAHCDTCLTRADPDDDNNDDNDAKEMLIVWGITVIIIMMIITIITIIKSSTTLSHVDLGKCKKKLHFLT